MSSTRLLRQHFSSLLRTVTAEQGVRSVLVENTGLEPVCRPPCKSSALTLSIPQIRNVCYLVLRKCFCFLWVRRDSNPHCVFLCHWFTASLLQPFAYAPIRECGSLCYPKFPCNTGNHTQCGFQLFNRNPSKSSCYLLLCRKPFWFSLHQMIGQEVDFEVSFANCDTYHVVKLIFSI